MDEPINAKWGCVNSGEANATSSRSNLSSAIRGSNFSRDKTKETE
jgi:hypothetical protein